MKHSDINTKKNKIERGNRPNNNGFSFPTLSGSTNHSYQATSTIFEDEIFSSQTKENYYSICLDWLEFICTTKKPLRHIFTLNGNQNIQITKLSISKNYNFRDLHRIYLNGVEICDIFSTPNNYTHKQNEVSVKMANHVLYSDQCYQYILLILDAFKMSFERLARLDIALDGADVLNVLALLNKKVKSKTIQHNNRAIKIQGINQDDDTLDYKTFCIGKSKSGVSARVYNKTNEIIKSGKSYISDYWKANGISTDNVGRFEIQLNYKRLEKYQFCLQDLQRLSDAESLGGIFTNEVRQWLKLYRVRKKDVLNHKKEVAIKKGSEIQYIRWSKIPTKQILSKDIKHISQSTFINARNTISFTLNEILLHPETSTTAQVEVIQKYANDYHLEKYVNSKVIKLFGFQVKSPYLQILNPLLRSGDLDEKMT